MFGKKLRLIERSASPTPAAVPVASLELLYRHHYSWLLAQVRRRFGSESAEDLVQETYLRASAYQGAEVRNPRALLIQIASNAARDSARRRASRPVLLELGDQEGATPEDQAQSLVLKQVILSLPPLLKQVFVLSRFAGLTYEEIADQCGISVKTVEWRMTKALKRLTAQLAP
jgi:RNA polymerase sigma-70 factor (ECF subfamily)